MSVVTETSVSDLRLQPERRQAFVASLKDIVGARYVLATERGTRPYRTGFRFGEGRVLAVVRPGSLVEQWRILAACVAADVIVIAQASNTGLTGGSTPDGDAYDRDVVIVSLQRLARIHVIAGGAQVICLPGATLDALERALRPLGREPHSVIGSSCIGASVIGGICNNSGGALVRRGPAYTQLSLYAQVDAHGILRLVNHLGVRLGDTAEAMLARLDAHGLPEDAIDYNGRLASDRDYAAHVRDVDADTPARYNADPTRLYEASGSAGKVMVFAVRLDTFPIESGAKVFYIGTNVTAELTALRRGILASLDALPIAGEYMHRDAFDIAARYGKDTFLMIDRFGTERLSALFRAKRRCDAWLGRLPFVPAHLSDRVLQAVSRLFGPHLPARIVDYRQRFEHHLMLKVSAQAADEMRRYLAAFFGGAAGDWFECTEEEGAKAFLHRFAAAGAAVRYRNVHAKEVEDIVALDVALRRNERDWFETLPGKIERAVAIKLYYGHFFCHVFHQDYIVRKGTDCVALEHAMWSLLDRRGAQYPAEHNVGHLYRAGPALRAFYEALDPCNCMNAGIGQTSKFKHYRDAS